MADLKKLARLLLDAAHLRRLLELVAHLLLAIDMLALAQTVAGVLAVHPVGSRNDNRVDVLILFVEHLAVVFIGLDIHPVATEERLSLLALEFPYVAYGADADARNARKRGRKHTAFSSPADHRNVDRCIVRSNRTLILRQLVLVVTKNAETRQKACRNRGTFKKVSSVGFYFHVLNLLNRKLYHTPSL